MPQSRLQTGQSLHLQWSPAAAVLQSYSHLLTSSDMELCVCDQNDEVHQLRAEEVCWDAIVKVKEWEWEQWME